jgi:hypothetical protein
VLAAASRLWKGRDGIVAPEDIVSGVVRRRWAAPE